MEKSSKSNKYSIIKWLKTTTGADIAKKLDEDERAFVKKINAQSKDRFTPIERSKLLANLKNNENKNATSTTSTEDYIKQLFTDSSITSLDNARLRKMTPEISQASAFMVSAIISPNDLCQGEIAISCDETSLGGKQKEVEKFLKEFFEEKLILSTNLPKWIDEALYNSGAAVLLTIPMNSIEQELLSENTPTISKESLDQLDSYNNKTSLFGISNESFDVEETISNTVDIATESLLPADNDSRPMLKRVDRDNVSNAWADTVKTVLSSGLIKISDNPYTLRTAAINNATAEISIEAALNKNNAFGVRKKGVKAKKDDGIKDFVQMELPKGPLSGEPLFVVAPTESTIPIFVPGSPSTPLGYIFVIDQNGHFATMNSNEDTNQSPGNRFNRNINRYNFDQLYAASGFNSNNGVTRSGEADQVMAKLFQAIVEDHIDNTVRKGGFKNFSLGSNPSVYKYMFHQYLCNRQSQLLYIPAEMVTYLTFEYGPDGRGVSDLENAKYVLSLRTTLQTCKILSGLNAAIDRKKLTIHNSDDDKGRAYALSQIRTIIQEHIAKNRWAITNDPQQTANQLIEKAITVNVENVPGFNYTVEDVPNQKESVPIDDGLSEELYKQLIMALYIPAAAMNALDADEYSRSVVTANLFTSNLIMIRQRIVVRAISELLRHYAFNSPIIRRNLLDILATPEDEKDMKSNNGNLDPDKLKKSDEERLNNVIDSISITLPPPNIAPNKAMYEIINDMASGADTMINAAYEDALAGESNPAILDALRAAKALMKHKYITDAISANGLSGSETVNLHALDSSDVTEIRTMLINWSKNLIRQDKTYETKKDDDEVGGGGDQFGGGGFGAPDAGGFGDAGGGDFGGGAAGF